MKKVLVLRTCAADMTSFGAFKWPKRGPVEAPDWNPEPCCGQGLHGWLWGQGDANVTTIAQDAQWLVVEVVAKDIVDLDGKVKFPRGRVVVCGSRERATSYIAERAPKNTPVIGATVTAGERGTATAGYAGTATAGNRGTATAGNRGTATAGDYGTATAGDYGTATAGYAGTAAAGDYGTATAGELGTATAGYAGTATAGDYGTAAAGHYGIIVLRWYDGHRYRLAVRHVGEDGLQAGRRYKCDDSGRIVDA